MSHQIVRVGVAMLAVGIVVGAAGMYYAFRAVDRVRRTWHYYRHGI